MCGAGTMARRQRHYILWLKSIPLPDKAPPKKKNRAVRSSATCYPADKFKGLVGSGWKDRLPCGRCKLHRDRPKFSTSGCQSCRGWQCHHKPRTWDLVTWHPRKGGKKCVFLFGQKSLHTAEFAIQFFSNDCPISLSASKKYPKVLDFHFHMIPSQLAVGTTSILHRGCSLPWRSWKNSTVKLRPKGKARSQVFFHESIPLKLSSSCW